MKPIKELSKEDKVLRIYQDETPTEPEEEGIILVHYHKDFYKESEEISKEDTIKVYHGEKIEQQKTYYIYPVSALIHSGVWLSLASSFDCDAKGWDTSHVGLILIRKDIANKKQSWDIAKSYIKVYNDYLVGNVYGFELIKKLKGKFCKCCKHRLNSEEEILNSCWGYYGEEGYKQILEENGFKAED